MKTLSKNSAARACALGPDLLIFSSFITEYLTEEQQRQWTREQVREDQNLAVRGHPLEVIGSSNTPG